MARNIEQAKPRLSVFSFPPSFRGTGGGVKAGAYSEIRLEGRGMIFPVVGILEQRAAVFTIHAFIAPIHRNKYANVFATPLKAEELLNINVVFDNNNNSNHFPHKRNSRNQ